MAHYVVGLGSNLGSRRANLAAAIEALQEKALGRIAAVSALYESDAVGPPQPAYLNAAVRLESELAPRALLASLLELETAFGRERRVRWGARTLDLDLLWSSAAWHDEALVIPHPRLIERSFALAPLLDVAPELSVTYGAQLDSLGGPPPERAWGAAAGVHDHGGVLEAAAEGPDFADALADALGALSRALSGARAATEPATVEVVEVAEANLAKELVAVLVSRAARGLALGRAVLGPVRGARREARLTYWLSSSIRPSPDAGARAIRVARMPVIAGERVAISLGG